MKKLLTGLVLILFSFQSYSQQVYWQCSNVVIDNPSAFLSVWDDFMNSDLGKSFSANAIFQFDQSSSEFSATHQICWFSEDASALQANFQKFMSAKMVNAAGIWETWNENVEQEANVLGQSLIADPAGFDLQFAAVYYVKVEDPASYGAAFTKMKKAFDATDSDGVLELHEILAGGEPGVTHEVIVRSKSMASWLEGRNKFVASKDFQDFIASTRPYSEVLHVLTGSPVKFYNVQ
jgi:hypothetical protein|tara:strand:+ start:36 stop:740 length:705 start_codon:yes stop_codon:yes gene_type:complete